MLDNLTPLIETAKNVAADLTVAKEDLTAADAALYRAAVAVEAAQNSLDSARTARRQAWRSVAAEKAEAVKSLLAIISAVEAEIDKLQLKG